MGRAKGVGSPAFDRSLPLKGLLLRGDVEPPLLGAERKELAPSMDPNRCLGLGNRVTRLGQR